jgi:DNA polymerase III delta subunit
MARPRTKSAPSGPVKFTGSERLVVLHGKEEFLQAEYLRLLREALAEAHGEIDPIRYDGSSATLADVLDELRSLGLMQQYKLVIITDADDLVSKHREALERYAEAPEEQATLVLRPGTWNANWRLHKAAVKVGQVVKCEHVDAHTAGRWATKRIEARYGRRIAPRAAAALVERLGTSLTRLDSELAKLAASVSEGQTVDIDQVEAMTGRASERMAWEMQEALLSGQPEAALAKLHELLDLAGQPKELVMYFVADLLRKLHRAAGMVRARVNEFNILKELKVWPQHRQPPFMHAVRALDEAGAAALLAQLTEADSRAKSGYGDHRRSLEEFCILFTGRVR